MRPALKNKTKQQSSLRNKFRSKLPLPQVGRSKFVEKKSRRVSFAIATDDRDDENDIDVDIQYMSEIATSSLDKQFDEIIQEEDDGAHFERRHLHFDEDDEDDDSFNSDNDHPLRLVSHLIRMPQHCGVEFLGIDELFLNDDSQNDRSYNNDDDDWLALEDPLFCAADNLFSADSYFNPSTSEQAFERVRSMNMFDKLQIGGRQISSNEVIDALAFPSKPQFLLDRTPASEESSIEAEADKEEESIESSAVAIIYQPSESGSLLEPSIELVHSTESQTSALEEEPLPEPETEELILEPLPEKKADDLIHGRGRNIFLGMLEEHIRMKRATMSEMHLRRQRTFNCAARVIFDDIMKVKMTNQTRVSRLQRALKSRKTVTSEIQTDSDTENKEPPPRTAGVENRRFQVSTQTRRDRLNKATRRLKVHEREGMSSPQSSDDISGFWSLKLQSEKSRVNKLLKTRKYGEAPLKYDLKDLAASIVLYSFRLKARVLGQTKQLYYEHGETTLYCFPFEHAAVFALHAVVYFFRLNLAQANLGRLRFGSKPLCIGGDRRLTIYTEYVLNSPRENERIVPKLLEETKEKKEEDSTIAEELEFFYSEEAGNLAHPSFKVFVVTALIETDLSRDAYINAHNKSQPIDFDDEDDGLGLELMVLPWLEADLRSELCEISLKREVPQEEEIQTRKEHVLEEANQEVLIEVEEIKSPKTQQSPAKSEHIPEEDNQTILVEDEPPEVQSIDLRKKNQFAVVAGYEAFQAPSFDVTDGVSYATDHSESTFDETEARRIVDAALRSLNPTETALIRSLPVIQPLIGKDQAELLEDVKESVSSFEDEADPLAIALCPNLVTSSLSDGAGSVSVGSINSFPEDSLQEGIFTITDSKHIPSLLSATTSISTSEFIKEPENLHMRLDFNSCKCAETDKSKNTAQPCPSVPSCLSPSNTSSNHKDTLTLMAKPVHLLASKTALMLEERSSPEKGDVSDSDSRPSSGRKMRPSAVITGRGTPNTKRHAQFHPKNGFCFAGAGIEVIKQLVCSPPKKKHFEAANDKSSFDRSSFDIEVSKDLSSESERSMYVIRSMESMDSSDAKEKPHYSNENQTPTKGNVRSPTWSMAPILSSFSNLSELSNETGQWSLEPYLTTSAERNQETFKEKLRKAAKESGSEKLNSSLSRSNIESQGMFVDQSCGHEEIIKTLGTRHNEPIESSTLGIEETPLKITCSEYSDVSMLTIEVSIEAETHYSETHCSETGLHNISIDDGENVETELNEIVLPSNSSEASQDADECRLTFDDGFEIDELRVGASLSSMESNAGQKSPEPKLDILPISWMLSSDEPMGISDRNHDERKDDSSPVTSEVVKDYTLEVLYSANWENNSRLGSPIAEDNRVAHYRAITDASRVKIAEKHEDVQETAPAVRTADSFSNPGILRLLSDFSESNGQMETDTERTWISGVISSVSEDDEDGGHARKMKKFHDRLSNTEPGSDWDTSGDWDNDFDSSKSPSHGSTTQRNIVSEQRPNEKRGWTIESIGEMIWSPFKAPPLPQEERETEEKLRYIRHF